MGRNFWSICNKCGVSLMHLRGEEGKTLHKFANDHYQHKESTEVLDDYVREPNEDYIDVFDNYYDRPIH